MPRSFLAIVASAALLANLELSAAVPKPGSITATDLAGTSFDLANEKEHVVIVNFWATWCAPCRAEMPALDAYYRRHKTDGLTMLAVSLDASASIKKLLTVTAPYSFRVARIDDVKMPRSAIPAALPATRVYDRDGMLRYDSASMTERPALDDGMLERVVTPLLATGVTTR